MNKTDNTLINLSTRKFIDVEENVVNLESSSVDNIPVETFVKAFDKAVPDFRPILQKTYKLSNDLVSKISKNYNKIADMQKELKESRDKIIVINPTNGHFTKTNAKNFKEYKPQLEQSVMGIIEYAERAELHYRRFLEQAGKELGKDIRNPSITQRKQSRLALTILGAGSYIAAFASMFVTGSMQGHSPMQVINTAIDNPPLLAGLIGLPTAFTAFHAAQMRNVRNSVGNGLQLMKEWVKYLQQLNNINVNNISNLNRLEKSAERVDVLAENISNNIKKSEAKFKEANKRERSKLK